MLHDYSDMHWLLLQDFLNGVCTHTIWVTDKRLTYYTGTRLLPGIPQALSLQYSS